MYSERRRFLEDESLFLFTPELAGFNEKMAVIIHTTKKGYERNMPNEEIKPILPKPNSLIKDGAEAKKERDKTGTIARAIRAGSKERSKEKLEPGSKKEEDAIRMDLLDPNRPKKAMNENTRKSPRPENSQARQAAGDEGGEDMEKRRSRLEGMLQKLGKEMNEEELNSMMINPAPTSWRSPDKRDKLAKRKLIPSSLMESP